VRGIQQVRKTNIPQNQNAFTLEESYMRILIAEDDAASATFVRKGLEAEHYAVDVSQYGEQPRGHGV
jgi:hypothetical protein